jgi:porphobilinogen synthase
MRAPAPTSSRPSDMMDGRIGEIRDALELDGHMHTRILAVQREVRLELLRSRSATAVGSAGALGQGQQVTPTRWIRPNSDEALREVALDLDEGADMDDGSSRACPYLGHRAAR